MEPSTDPAPLAVARAEFAKYHRLATGTDAPEELVSLAVDPSVSETGNDAYAIVSAGGGATVTGSNPRSVLYGVYDLLARRAGCRWFWDGDIVPRCAAIDLSGLDVHEESRFRYRAIRYFAHRGLTRFQAEHWGFDDWRREIDWCVKRRLNCILPRIGMDDLWQRAFPDVVPYPDPSKPLPGAGTGYDDRSPFWPLQFRGRLRRAVADYAFARGLRIPADFGTMTHWYSRTPREFLEREKPAFLPQAGGDYGEPDGLVFDIRDRRWLDAYWRLTEAAVEAGYCSPDLLHTIGLGERTVYADRARNLALKTDVLRRLTDLAAERAPGAPVLLAGWDFHYGWTPEEVRTALAALDPERVVLWDYEADAAPVPRPDRTRTAFTDWGVVGRFPYTFGAFLAYEQALDVRANYPLLENRLAVAENDPACKGFLFWPESSHTDVFALRWFSENAWRPGGKTADALLPPWRAGAETAPRTSRSSSTGSRRTGPTSPRPRTGKGRSGRPAPPSPSSRGSSGATPSRRATPSTWPGRCSTGRSSGGGARRSVRFAPGREATTRRPEPRARRRTPSPPASVRWRICSRSTRTTRCGNPWNGWTRSSASPTRTSPGRSSTTRRTPTASRTSSRRSIAGARPWPRALPAPSAASSTPATGRRSTAPRSRPNRRRCAPPCSRRPSATCVPPLPEPLKPSVPSLRVSGKEGNREASPRTGPASETRPSTARARAAPSS